MTRIISRAENFETVFEAFQQINFAAFDFNTIKESLIEYVKLEFPETFNDFIESSEFIAILELFAYISELYSYRLDINAHENFITQAVRKQSILRLAKLISYKASRNIPSRGLVKIQSIKTTENLFDSNGINLSNRVIRWNDPNNDNWKEQFILVMNRVLRQDFGTVAPGERIQVDDVVFELYEWENTPLANGVFPFTASVSGISVPMELVPSALNRFGPLERRPNRNASFSLLFGNDGLGDGSDTTGFFCFAKQGTLAFQTTEFDGVTTNQTFEINVQNINDTDVFVNNIDPNTGDIIDDGSIVGARSGEWQEVDLAHAQNIIFNTNPNRNKFEVETLENDEIKLIFGDAEFANIPSGTFDIWFRTSLNEEINIPKNSVINRSAGFTYIGLDGNTQSITFEFSLINSIQNGSPGEDLDHIRRVAPSVYYTQDRMVNSRDYNTFMLQDITILKLRAINRTFAGDSKFIAWHDPRETYEDVKLFGDDLALYFKLGESSVDVFNVPSASEIFNNFVEPLLSSSDFFTILSSEGVSPGDIRTTFTNDEEAFIIQEMELAALSPPQVLELFYTISSDHWNIGGGLIIYYVANSAVLGSRELFRFNILTQSWESTAFIEQINPTDPPPALPIVNTLWLTRPDNTVTGFLSDALYRWTGTMWIFVPSELAVSDVSPNLLGFTPDPDPEGIRLITITVEGGFDWNISHATQRIIAHSPVTRFWNTNDANSVVSFDTLLSNRDSVTILAANKDDNRTGLLQSNFIFDILGAERAEPNIAQTGLIDIHQLSVLPEDTDDDGIPNGMDLAPIIDPSFTITDFSTLPVDIDLPFITLFQDISIVSDLSETIEFYYLGNLIASPITNTLIDRVRIVSEGTNTFITINVTEYAYFQRVELNINTGEFTWEPRNITEEVVDNWINRASTSPEEWKREHGRFPMNFLWKHITPRLNLIDPAASNIIDIFVITRAHFSEINRWLSGIITIRPKEPTPLDLRTAYNSLLDNKMISDTVILHSGKFKILFGSLAIPELRAKFKVIRNQFSILTNNQIKVRIVGIIQAFFDIDKWEFGETFHFTELASRIHIDLISDISSVVIVPLNSINQFGDLFQVPAREDEILQPHIRVSDIEIVESLNPQIIRQTPG